MADTIAGRGYFCTDEEGQFTCQYFQKSKLNSSIYWGYSYITSGMDHTAAVPLPVLSVALASYPKIYTNTKGWKAEMKYCHCINTHLLCSLVKECAMIFRVCKIKSVPQSSYAGNISLVCFQETRNFFLSASSQCCKRYTDMHANAYPSDVSVYY